MPPKDSPENRAADQKPTSDSRKSSKKKSSKKSKKSDSKPYDSQSDRKKTPKGSPKPTPKARANSAASGSSKRNQDGSSSVKSGPEAASVKSRPASVKSRPASAKSKAAVSQDASLPQQPKDSPAGGSGSSAGRPRGRPKKSPGPKQSPKPKQSPNGNVGNATGKSTSAKSTPSGAAPKKSPNQKGRPKAKASPAAGSTGAAAGRRRTQSVDNVEGDDDSDNANTDSHAAKRRRIEHGDADDGAENQNVDDIDASVSAFQSASSSSVSASAASSWSSASSSDVSSSDSPSPAQQKERDPLAGRSLLNSGLIETLSDGGANSVFGNSSPFGQSDVGSSVQSPSSFPSLAKFGERTAAESSESDFRDGDSPGLSSLASSRGDSRSPSLGKKSPGKSSSPWTSSADGSSPESSFESPGNTNAQKSGNRGEVDSSDPGGVSGFGRPRGRKDKKKRKQRVDKPRHRYKWTAPPTELERRHHDHDAPSDSDRKHLSQRDLARLKARRDRVNGVLIEGAYVPQTIRGKKLLSGITPIVEVFSLQIAQFLDNVEIRSMMVAFPAVFFPRLLQPESHHKLPLLLGTTSHKSNKKRSSSKKSSRKRSRSGENLNDSDGMLENVADGNQNEVDLNGSAQVSVSKWMATAISREIDIDNYNPLMLLKESPDLGTSTSPGFGASSSSSPKGAVDNASSSAARSSSSAKSPDKSKFAPNPPHTEMLFELMYKRIYHIEKQTSRWKKHQSNFHRTFLAKAIEWRLGVDSDENNSGNTGAPKAGDKSATARSRSVFGGRENDASVPNDPNGPHDPNLLTDTALDNDEQHRDAQNSDEDDGSDEGEDQDDGGAEAKETEHAPNVALAYTDEDGGIKSKNLHFSKRDISKCILQSGIMERTWQFRYFFFWRTHCEICLKFFGSKARRNKHCPKTKLIHRGSIYVCESCDLGFEPAASALEEVKKMGLKKCWPNLPKAYAGTMINRSSWLNDIRPLLRRLELEAYEAYRSRENVHNVLIQLLGDKVYKDWKCFLTTQKTGAKFKEAENSVGFMRYYGAGEVWRLLNQMEKKTFDERKSFKENRWELKCQIAKIVDFIASVEETIRCCVPDLETVKTYVRRTVYGIRMMDKKIHALMPTQTDMRLYKGDGDPEWATQLKQRMNELKQIAECHRLTDQSKMAAQYDYLDDDADGLFGGDSYSTQAGGFDNPDKYHNSNTSPKAGAWQSIAFSLNLAMSKDGRHNRYADLRDEAVLNSLSHLFRGAPLAGFPAFKTEHDWRVAKVLAYRLCFSPIIFKQLEKANCCVAIEVEEATKLKWKFGGDTGANFDSDDDDVRDPFGSRNKFGKSRTRKNPFDDPFSGGLSPGGFGGGFDDSPSNMMNKFGAGLTGGENYDDANPTSGKKLGRPRKNTGNAQKDLPQNELTEAVEEMKKWRSGLKFRVVVKPKNISLTMNPDYRGFYGELEAERGADHYNLSFDPSAFGGELAIPSIHDHGLNGYANNSHGITQNATNATNSNGSGPSGFAFSADLPQKVAARNRDAHSEFVRQESMGSAGNDTSQLLHATTDLLNNADSVRRSTWESPPECLFVHTTRSGKRFKAKSPEFLRSEETLKNQKMPIGEMMDAIRNGGSKTSGRDSNGEAPNTLMDDSSFDDALDSCLDFRFFNRCCNYMEVFATAAGTEKTFGDMLSNAGTTGTPAESVISESDLVTSVFPKTAEFYAQMKATEQVRSAGLSADFASEVRDSRVGSDDKETFAQFYAREFLGDSAEKKAAKSEDATRDDLDAGNATPTRKNSKKSLLRNHSTASSASGLQMVMASPGSRKPEMATPGAENNPDEDQRPPPRPDLLLQNGRSHFTGGVSRLLLENHDAISESIQRNGTREARWRSGIERANAKRELHRKQKRGQFEMAMVGGSLAAGKRSNTTLSFGDTISSLLSLRENDGGSVNANVRSSSNASSNVRSSSNARSSSTVTVFGNGSSRNALSKTAPVLGSCLQELGKFGTILPMDEKMLGGESASSAERRGTLSASPFLLDNGEHAESINASSRTPITGSHPSSSSSRPALSEKPMSRLQSKLEDTKPKSRLAPKSRLQLPIGNSFEDNNSYGGRRDEPFGGGFGDGHFGGGMGAVDDYTGYGNTGTSDADENAANIVASSSSAADSTLSQSLDQTSLTAPNLSSTTLLPSLASDPSQNLTNSKRREPLGSLDLLKFFRCANFGASVRAFIDWKQEKVCQKRMKKWQSELLGKVNLNAEKQLLKSEGLRGALKSFKADHDGDLDDDWSDEDLEDGESPAGAALGLTTGQPASKRRKVDTSATGVHNQAATPSHHLADVARSHPQIFFRSGKYRGCSVDFVWQTDPEFCWEMMRRRTFFLQNPIICMRIRELFEQKVAEIEMIKAEASRK